VLSEALVRLSFTRRLWQPQIALESHPRIFIEKKNWTEFLTVCGGLVWYDDEHRLRFPASGIERESD
jgi:hypothetical protein